MVLTTPPEYSVAENLPGSVEIFAKAMGMTEAEMFKQMEAGKVLAEDVLPKVAKEYARAAREGGALDAAMKKNRSELNRLMNALTSIKNIIYTGGFGTGLNFAFTGMSNFLESTQDVAKVLGQVLKGALIGLTLPFEILGVFLDELSDLFGIANSDTLAYTATIVGMTVAFVGLYKILRLVVGAFLALKTAKSFIQTLLPSAAAGGAGAAGGAAAAGAGASRFLPAAMAATGTYNLATAAAGGIGLEGMLHSMNAKMENLVRYGSFSRPQKVDVNVNVNDGKVKELITAEVQQSNTENLNSILSSGTR